MGSICGGRGCEVGAMSCEQCKVDAVGGEQCQHERRRVLCCSEDDIDDIQKEVAVLAGCHCDNITEYHAAVVVAASSQLLIVMELMAATAADLVRFRSLPGCASYDDISTYFAGDTTYTYYVGSAIELC